jgi:NTE family protein
MRQMNAGPVVGVDMSQARGVDPAALQNPPSWWRWILSGDWKNGPPIVALLMRAATLTSDADVETSRKATDLLIQPEPEGMDIRDWKAYDIPVRAGYEAARAALDDLDGPVTDLRRNRVREAEEAETVTAPEPAEKVSGKARASRRQTASEKPA